MYKSVLRGAIKRLKHEDTSERAPPAASGCSEEALVRALDRREGKVEVAQVDMEQELRDLGLAQFFPTSTWPHTAPVSSSFLLRVSAFCVHVFVRFVS